MRKFRSHAAIAVDGGGIRGTMVARALSLLEQQGAFDGKTCNEVFDLAAGTSTGSILSAGLAAGLTGTQMFELYRSLGPSVFRRSLRSTLWFFFGYRFEPGTLRGLLSRHLRGTLGDIKEKHLVITAFDLKNNRTRFIKTGKKEYAPWSLTTAVLASCAVPTYFPPVDGQFVDGGVGSYANPCYLAAYEACIVKAWDPRDTTLISLGTGRDPHHFRKGEANHYPPWKWITPILGAFLESADDEQVRVVKTFFDKLDFRRFQVKFDRPIPLDDASPRSMEQLIRYGDRLAEMIMRDETDREAEEGAAILPGAMRS